MATIVHLANFYGPRSGGLRTSVHALAAGYVEQGHEVHVIVPGDASRSGWDGAAMLHEVPGVKVPRSGGYRVIVDRRPVLDLLESIEPDRVEISDRTTLLRAADWARARGIPSVMFAHERLDGVISSFAPGLPARATADRLNARAAERVDTIVCTTAFAAEEFDRIGVESERVPLGVDLSRFGPARRSTLWRSGFPRRFLALLCSRLSREKRPDFAMDVATAARRCGLPIHVVVAGDGPLARTMARKARNVGATMLGFVHDRDTMATILASVDVLMAPGPIETFGLAALEALASGTPVIANERSAVADVVGTDAGLALPLDPQAWIAGMAAMIARPRGQVSTDARTRAEQFGWDATVLRMLGLHGLTPTTPALTAA